MPSLGQCDSCGTSLAIISNMVNDADGRPISRDAAGKAKNAEYVWFVACPTCGKKMPHHPKQRELDDAAAALLARRTARVPVAPAHYTMASAMDMQDRRIAALEAEVADLKALLATAPHLPHNTRQPAGKR